MPWLLAPSRTRNGNRPLPAIRPHPTALVSALAMNLYRSRLLHNPAFRRLDEANQLLYIFRLAKQLAHFRERLAGVHLRAQQQAKRARQNLKPRLRKSLALQTDGVDAVTFRFALRHHARKRRHILRNHRRCADVGIAADAAKLMHRRLKSDRNVVLYGHMPPDRRALPKQRVVTNAAIAPHVWRCPHAAAASN